jgi:uncharacterized protein (TIGR03086 family)
MTDVELLADLDRTLAAAEAVVAGVGAAMVHVRIVENLVHGWDLARASGQPTDFPHDVAERALTRSRRRLTTRPEGPGAPFAAEMPVPADAPAADRLAGWLGRPV